MGEVYRAKDPRLGRDVAVKVLPEEFFEGEERRQRFEREARLLAALNHPGIAAVYSFEEISGRHILVMELVEGDDLAQRISSGALSLDESLSYARQIAEALEAAHEKGIVHRDLKPANVRVTHDGRVKLLDFGLAKMFEGDGGPGSAPSVTHSPTLTARATAAGVILGTAAYMSPEQARGKPLDKRTDVWAFGCVLYEMLTGRRAFEGETVSDTLAAVLKEEPNWAVLPEQTPVSVRKILRRCLQRDARLRLHDIADARLDLEELSTASATGSSAQLPFEEKTALPSPTVASAERTSRERGSKKFLYLSWAIAAACAAALGATWLLAGRSRPDSGWSGVRLGGPEIAMSPRPSPDGRLVAFQAMVDGQTQVAVMQPDSGDWTVLTRDRTRGIATSMSWSPDGTRIYYGRQDGVPRGVFSVPAVGGEERLVLEDARSPEVLADGSLLVHRLNERRQPQLYRFWPDGGRLQAYAALPSGAEDNTTRAFRDGKEAVFLGRTTEQPETDPNDYLYALDLGSGAVRRVATSLAFSRNTLLNQVVDVGADDRSIVLTVPAGDLTAIVEVPRGGGPPRALTTLTQIVWGLGVAKNGDLYVDQILRPHDALLMEPDGSRPQTVLSVDNLVYTPTLPLPDGRILFTVSVDGRRRLLAARPRGSSTPFAQTTEETSGPLAMVGSSEVAFLAGPAATRRLAIASVADGRIVRRLEKADGPRIEALASSPDGQTLYYAAGGKIWAIPAADGAPKPVCEGDSVAADPRGKHLVVQLNEKGTVRLMRVPVGGGPGQPLSFPGVRPAAALMPSNAVRADGVILKTSNASDAWPWYVAVLNPESGAAQRITLPSFLDSQFPGWTADGKILAFAARTHATIWRLRRESKPR